MSEPPSRVRRDPRERRASASARERVAVEATVRVREVPARWVAVILVGTVQPIDADRRMLALARRLAADDGAVLLVTGGTEAADYAGAGADRVIMDPALRLEGLDLQRAIGGLATLDAEIRPSVWLCPDTVLGREIAGSLAVRTGSEIARGLVRVEDGAPIVWSNGWEHRVCGARVLLLDPSLFPAEAIERAEARQLPPRSGSAGPFREIGVSREPATDIPLEEAPLIVAVGLGVDDAAAARRLADRLGAAFGATRPVCDAGGVERMRQIGASGRSVAPDVYVAFGISGAQQHLDGIGEARRVIAVNTDPSAPLMARAHTALLADADAVIAALAAKLGQP